MIESDHEPLEPAVSHSGSEVFVERELTEAYFKHDENIASGYRAGNEHRDGHR